MYYDEYYSHKDCLFDKDDIMANDWIIIDNEVKMSEDYKIVSVDCHGTFTCKRGLDTFVITQEGLKHLLLNELNKNN